MFLRTGIFLLSSLLLISCASFEKSAETNSNKEPEILYIYPDGRMEFDGRTMNKKDVVIYEDGRGGERAAVKVRVPDYPDYYRDTITVERKDIPVERKD